MNKILKIYSPLMESERLDLSGRANDEILAMIERDCQPYITRNPNIPLYRGMKAKGDAGIEVVRKDRKPVDTIPVIHNALVALQHELGQPRRDQVIFATTDMSTIYEDDYGLAYYIFPMGEYKISYVSGVRDLLEEMSLPLRVKIKLRTDSTDLKTFDEIINFIQDIKNVEGDPRGVTDADKEKAIEVLNKIIDKIKNNTIVNDLSEHSNEELMIECDTYYYIDVDQIELGGFNKIGFNYAE